MRKKIAFALAAAMVIGLVGCGSQPETAAPQPTPEPIVEKVTVTATPTPVVTKDWSKSMAPTYTPTPTPTLTPEEIAAIQAAEEARLAREKAAASIVIDLKNRISVDGSSTGAEADDGSVTWTENNMTKNLLPVGETLPAGKYLLTVKYSFNGTEDTKVRFYFSDKDNAGANATETYGFIDYAEGDAGVVKTVVLEVASNGDSNAFMFGGGSYGVSLNNFTLYSVSVKADNYVAVKFADRVAVDGSSTGADGEDGSVTWTENNMTKNLLPFSEKLEAGTYRVEAKYSFNGTEDGRVRFYFSDENQGNFTENNTYGYLDFNGSNEVQTSNFYMTSNGDSTAFMFGGGSYGVSLNNFTLYSVKVYKDNSVAADLSARVAVDGSSTGEEADGGVKWTENNMTKNLLPLAETLPAGKYYLDVKYSFNGTEDQKVRFYFSDANQGNFTVEYGYIEFNGSNAIQLITLPVESNGDSDAFMFGGGSYGVSLNNFTLYSVNVRPQ